MAPMAPIGPSGPGPIGNWEHRGSLFTWEQLDCAKAQRWMLSTLGDWRVLIEMMETHIRSVASRPNRIHHRVDVLAGVSRI